MLFIGQNLKHVLMKYSSHKPSIIFWLSLVDTFCLKFDFLQHQKILQRNVYSKGNDGIKAKRNTFSHVSDNDVEESYFF